MNRWSLDPILDSFWLVALSALILIALLFLTPGFAALGKSQRRWLTGLRIAVVALLLLAMLRPTHIHTSKQPQTAVLLILADKSRSMRLPQLAGGASRWEAQRKALLAIEPALRDLGRRLEVKVYAYDDALASVLEEGRLQLSGDPDGDSTDIGSVLHEAVRRELGKRLAGVILLGDGTQTALDPMVGPTEAARELAGLGFPLYTVVFGPSGDAMQSRDVAIESLPEQFTVFVKNQMAVRAQLRVRGYLNQPVPVVLTIEDAAGQQETIGPLELRAKQDGEVLPLELTHIPQTPGQYRMTLRAEPQDGELVTSNNELTAFLTVLDGGIKVLYLEGEPRQEQRILRWSLDASPDIELDFRWLPSRLRDRWPVDLGDAIDGKYDVYMIGDLDSMALGEDQLRRLAAAVDAGAGLLVMGGFHSFGPGGYRETAMDLMLPVEMQRLARQDFGSPDQPRWHHAGPLPMLPARSHPVTRLAPEDENLAAWRQLKPLQGANRFRRVKSAPGVQVLAETETQVPLLVAGEYGKGRVLAFAGDSTWQWWRQGRADYHKRFWRQSVLWLVRRDELTRSDVWIDLPQRRYAAGARVVFSVGAREATGDPIRDAAFSAELVSPTGSRQQLTLAPEREDFSARSQPLRVAGSYRIQVTASKNGRVLGTTEAEFQVMDQDVELMNPSADPDQMSRLANITSEAGGRMLPAEQLPDLLKTIADNPPELVEEVQQRWQLADTWWDASLFGLLFVGLLTTEWFLRKKWGLV